MNNTTKFQPWDAVFVYIGRYERRKVPATIREINMEKDKPYYVVFDSTGVSNWIKSDIMILDVESTRKRRIRLLFKEKS